MMVPFLGLGGHGRVSWYIDIHGLAVPRNEGEQECRIMEAG